MDTCSVRGDTVSQTNVLSFARINVIYLLELGGQLPPPPDPPSRTPMVGIMNLCNCQSRTHRRIEQTVKTNSSVGEFYAPPSKTADSKVVSVTRAEVMLCVGELIVEQNIPLALALA